MPVELILMNNQSSIGKQAQGLTSESSRIVAATGQTRPMIPPTIDDGNEMEREERDMTPMEKRRAVKVASKMLAVSFRYLSVCVRVECTAPSSSCSYGLLGDHSCLDRSHRPNPTMYLIEVASRMPPGATQQRCSTLTAAPTRWRRLPSNRTASPSTHSST